jgi:hypothetical protein
MQEEPSHISGAHESWGHHCPKWSLSLFGCFRFRRLALRVLRHETTHDLTQVLAFPDRLCPRLPLGVAGQCRVDGFKLYHSGLPPCVSTHLS